MFDYAQLQAEISQPAYAGMDDQQIADKLKTPSITVWRDVAIADLQAYFLLNGVIRRYRQFIAAPPPDASEELKNSAADLLEGLEATRIPTFRFSVPAIRDQLNRMTALHVQAGLLTAADVAVITDLAQTQQSWAQVHSWPGVGAGDVERARST